MRNIWCLTILWLCIVLVSCNTTTKEKQAVEKIIFLRELNTSIAESPLSDSLLLYRAQLLLENQYIELGIEDCQAAWEVRPTVSAALCKSQSLLLKGAYEECIIWLKYCIDKLGNKPSLLYSLAEVYYQLNDSTDALNVLKNLDETHLTTTMTYDLVVLLSDLGELEQSNRLIDKVVEQSTSIEPYLMKTYLMIQAGKAGVLSFLDSISTIASFQDKLADIYYLYGAFFYSQNALDKSYDYYERATKLEWRFQSAYIGKAQILKQKHKYQDAINQLYIASEVDNPTGILMQETADCYLALKDTTEALSYYELAVQLDSTNQTLLTQIEYLQKK